MGLVPISDCKIWKFTSPSTYGRHHTTRHSQSVLNNKTIQYNAHALRCIASKVEHDNRLCILPFNANRTIRDHRLNIKPLVHRKRKQRPQLTGINRDNLIRTKCNQSHDPNIIIATLNIQSLHSKELQVSDIFKDYSIDAILLTETWLSIKDKEWCAAKSLNKNNLKLSTHHRSESRGGGLALTCKSYYQVKLLGKGTLRSFEHATWELTIKSGKVAITSIYHPPYSAKNRILSDSTNNVILGDFNLHVSDDGDAEAATFTDICETLGLYQHIAFPTHRSGNVLDLILTEVCNNTMVLRSHRGPFVLDHTLVMAKLYIK